MITANLGYDRIAQDVTHSVGNFTENPYLRPGDADSGHGVVFGELEGYGDVAIKPHTKHQRALLESRNLGRAAEVGIDAVDPIMVAAGGLSSYLVTRYQSGLTHLGQTDWAIEAGSPSLQAIAEPALAYGAHVIAERHNHGVVNLDSQIRNIVSDAEGKPVFVDAEKAVFHQSPAIQAQLADKDVMALGTSVLHRGLLDGKTPNYRVGYLTDAILEPYLDEVKPDLFVTPPPVRTVSVQTHWNSFIQHAKKHAKTLDR